MMDAFIGGMNAYQQVGMLLGGLLMIAIGGAILADFIWWRLKAKRYEGTITGVRCGTSTKSNQAAMYYPVIEYQNGEEKTVRGETDSGSSILSTKIPGRKVGILVMDRDPHTVRIKGYILPVLGVCFAVPGLFLLIAAFTSFDFSIYTVLIGTVLLGFIGYKVSKMIKPRDQWENVQAFRERKKQERVQKREAMEVLGLEQVHERLMQQDKTNLKFLPIAVLIGLILAGVGVHLALDQKYMQAEGQRAEGRVVNIHSEYSSDSDGGGSYVYYPVVEFHDTNDRAITFRDRIGSNPASYRIGDMVTVLYDPANPGKVFIDLGAWNWLPSIVILIVGMLIVWFGVNGLLSIRSRIISLDPDRQSQRDDKSQGSFL